MILHLTSQYKGRRVLICGDSVTVTDNAGLINFSTKQLERGCTVDDVINTVATTAIQAQQG